LARKKRRKKNKLQHENIYGLPYSIGRPQITKDLKVATDSTVSGVIFSEFQEAISGDISVHGSVTTTSGFWKNKRPLYIQIKHPVLILACSRHWHISLHWHTKFRVDKEDHRRRSYDVISIFDMAALTSRINFRFHFNSADLLR